MAEQCHEQSNLFQVECHGLIFSLRLKTANWHSVKVKIQPKYTKSGNYTNTAWRYWSPTMYMSGNGRCNYNKYMYPPQWSLDLCAGPSGGRDKHFSTYFVPLSLWKLVGQKLDNIEHLSTLLTQPHNYCIFFGYRKQDHQYQVRHFFNIIRQVLQTMCIIFPACTSGMSLRFWVAR